MLPDVPRVRGKGCSDVPLEFVVGDVQMSPGAVCGKGCSDVPSMTVINR